MSIKKDMSLPPAPPVPWRLAVVTTADHPDLATTLSRRLWPLLRDRAKAGPVSLLSPGGPADSVAAALANDRGWLHSSVGSCTDPPFRPGPRSWATAVANADAAVLVFADEVPPAALTRLAEFAVWLRVPVRWVRVS